MALKPKTPTTTRPYIAIEALKYARSARPDLDYLSDRALIEVALITFATNNHVPTSIQPKEIFNATNDRERTKPIADSSRDLHDPTDIDFD